MKNYIRLTCLFSLWAIMLYSCNNETSISTSPIASIGYRDFNVYVIDSCEYIGSSLQGYSAVLAHKGNCKYCAQRNLEILRKVVDDERYLYQLNKNIDSVNELHSHIPKKIVKGSYKGPLPHSHRWDIDLSGTNQGIGTPEFGNEPMNPSSWRRMSDYFHVEVTVPSVDTMTGAPDHNRPRKQEIIFQADPAKKAHLDEGFEIWLKTGNFEYFFIYPKT